MNDLEFKNIEIAINNYKHICLSFDDYLDLFRSNVGAFELILDLDIIKTGKYAKNILNKFCWVNKSLNQGYMKISNNEDIVNASDPRWSQIIKLDEFERVFNLKLFW